MYTYFDGLLDKYIKLDMTEEQKEQLNAIFNTASSDDQMKNRKKAMKIVKDELKTQIKEEGEFEKERITIDVGDKEKKVTKSTLILSQKDLYNVVSNICSNLASNDDFLDCFKESPKDMLRDLADEIKNAKTNSKNDVKISIYTKGILNNFVGLDIAIYSAESRQTITISIVKEHNDLYTYNVSSKMTGAKVDVIKGKVKTEKDKNSRDEQEGKTTITAEITGIGTATITMDYSVNYNKDIDEVDVSNSINMTQITEQDMQSIMNKLIERPLIGDLIIRQMNETANEDNITDGSDNLQTKNDITTPQNEVRDEDYGYSVTYSIPNGFKYKSDYSNDDSKYYNLGDYNSESQVEANVSLKWYTESEYYEHIKWDYDNNNASEYYKNVNLDEEKTIKVGEKEFKYKILTYESNSEYYNEKYQNAYIWCMLDKEHVFSVELESTNTEIAEDMIKGFLNINVTKLN